MTGLLHDLRCSIRQLRKSPAFVAVAIVTLTLGIGVNTAIFNVIEAVVLRPLPFADPDRLVWLNGKMPQTDDGGISPADFLDYRDANRSFERMAGISQVVMAGPSNLSGDKEIMERFRRSNEQGTTIIQVTHSGANAAYGSRTIQIRDGWLVSDTAHPQMQPYEAVKQ